MQLQGSNASLQVVQPRKPYNTLDEYRKTFWILGIIGGIFVQLVVGSVYQWGIINIYITSYYRTLQSGVTLEGNAIIFPIIMLCTGPTLRVGLYLSQKTHPLLVLLVNQTLLAAVVFISSYMQHMTLFAIFYGVLFGLLSGISYLIPIVQCNKFFPGYKMYVNGGILIGTGVGSVVFGMFSYNFLNPQKLKPVGGYYEGSVQLLEVAGRVPQLLKWLALIYLLVGLCGVAMLIPTCTDNRKRLREGLQTQQQHEYYLHESVQQRYLPLNKADTMCDGLQSLVFWLKIVIVMLVACGPFLINGNYKTYVKKTISDDQFLTLVGVIGSIGNGCSRILWNLFFNKTGYKTVLLTLIVIEIIVFSTIHLAKHNKAAYLIEVLFANICIGGIFGTAPSFSQIVFGHKTGSNLYGFIFLAISTANFIAFGYVKGLSPTITFDGVIYIVLGMVVACIPLIVIPKFQGNWLNSTVSLQYSVTHQIHQSQKRQAFRAKQTSLQGSFLNIQDLIKKQQQFSNTKDNRNSMQVDAIKEDIDSKIQDKIVQNSETKGQQKQLDKNQASENGMTKTIQLKRQASDENLLNSSDNQKEVENKNQLVKVKSKKSKNHKRHQKNQSHEKNSNIANSQQDQMNESNTRLVVVPAPHEQKEAE